MNEITKIDRRTREIIWRLGGKNNDFTFINDELGFSHQHSVSRTPSGTILLFDNGNGRPTPNFSSPVEYDLDEINMTATLVKRFERDPSIFVAAAGNTQRIHNGNTLVGWNKTLYAATEFHPDGSLAMNLSNISPNRIEKFLWKTKLFETDVDSLDFGHYNGINPIHKTIELTNNSANDISITSYSTHTENFELTTSLPLTISSNETVQIEVIFDPSLSNLGYIKDLITLNHDVDTQRIARQVWLFGTQEDDIIPSAEITPNGNNILTDTTIVIHLTEPIRTTKGKELTYNTIDNYIVFRLNDINGADLDFDAIINTEKKTIKIFPSDSLLTDQQYYISILGNLCDYSGNELPLTEATFYTGNKVGIDKDDFNKEMMVLFPNPSSGNFKISTGNYELKFVSIYDLSGKLIEHLRSEDKIIEIDISNQVSGQYIVLIKDEQQQIIKTFKLIKQ